jgi:hypothetical protein
LDSGRCERSILAQDRPLQLTQFRARLDAQLLDQHASRFPIGLEGFCLPARPVEGEDQLTTQPLAKGMLGDQPLQLGDDLGMVAKLEPGVDLLLEHGLP